MPVDIRDVVDYSGIVDQNQRELNRTSTGNSAEAKPPDPVNILLAAMGQEAEAYTQEGIQRQKQAAVAAETMLYGTDSIYNSQVSHAREVSSAPVISNQTLANPLDETYMNVIKRIPAGQQYTASVSKNVKATVEQSTGDTLLYVDRPRNTDPYKVAAAQINAAGIKGPEKFDVEALLAKAQTLTGDDLLDYIVTASAQIEMQATKERQRIRAAAATESGYAAHEAALQRNIALDMASPYYRTNPTPSAQTEQVQGMLNSARVTMDSLAVGLEATDTTIAQLSNAKRSLLTLEAKRADRQQRKEDRDEEKVASVTDDMVKNYKFLVNPTMDDDAARKAIVKVKDKALQKLLTINDSNIWSALADNDKYVKDGALRLVLEHEKATDDVLRESKATSSPLTSLIKSAQDDHKVLLQAMPPDKAADWTVKYQIAPPKEKAEMRTALYAQWLPKYVENRISNVFLGNVGNWTSPEVTGGTDLGKVIGAVKKTDPKGNAPIGSVIDQFIQGDFKKADGAELTNKEKVAILDVAFKNQIKSLKQNIIMTPDLMQGIQDQMSAQVRNYANRAAIRKTAKAFNYITDRPLAGGLGFLNWLNTEELK